MTEAVNKSLSAITAQAKESWKENVQSKKADKPSKNSNKSKSNGKRSTKRSDGPPNKKRKLNKAKTASNKKRISFDLPLDEQKQRSVIKLQNMPSGLEESQLLTFFKQFGHVTRLCLKRHRYGRSLRYAYVEFDHPEIAKIVQETLDCTSMYGQFITVREIAPEKVNGSQFFRTNSIEEARCYKKFDNEKIKWNKAATIANLEFKFKPWIQELVRDENRINENLKANGIDYQFHGFQDALPSEEEADESKPKQDTKEESEDMKNADEDSFVDDDEDDDIAIFNGEDEA